MDELFTFDPLVTGTKGLVFVGDKVLVYRRDNKTANYPLCLDLPGGGAEPNETPFEIFKREVWEEFGLTIAPTDITYTRRYPGVLNPDKNAYFVVAKLKAELQTQIRFGDEGLEYMLMPLHEFLERTDAWPAFQERATEYLRTLSS